MTTKDISTWGSDHWSTLGYVETRIVDHKGVLDRRHLRGHLERRPDRHPTRMKGGVELSDHDDYDCIADMLALGILETKSDHDCDEDLFNLAQDLEIDLGDLAETYIETEKAFVFTSVGQELASALREHKANGKNWASFSSPKNLAFRSKLKGK